MLKILLTYVLTYSYNREFSCFHLWLFYLCSYFIFQDKETDRQQIVYTRSRKNFYQTLVDTSSLQELQHTRIILDPAQYSVSCVS